jgi:hypothetical protein
MARGKKSRASPAKALNDVRGIGVLIEEMRAQNRATIETVEASRVALEGKIDSLARDTGGRLTVLEAAVRQNSRDIKENSEDIRKNRGPRLDSRRRARWPRPRPVPRGSPPRAA